MIGSNKLNKPYLKLAMFVILLCASITSANESKPNKLSISDRFLNNSSLILSYPITIAKTNEIAQDTLISNSSRQLALEYVEEASENGKKTRLLNGYFNFASALMWIIVGLADKGENNTFYFDDDYPEFDDSPTARNAYRFAAMHSLIGIGYLTSSSPAESEYVELLEINDLAQRQDAATKSLEYIAKKEKRRRISRGVFSVVLGTAYVVIQPIQTSAGKSSILNAILGTFNIGVAAYNFGSPSNAENSLKHYNRIIKSDKSLKVQLRSNYSNEIQLVMLKNL